MMFWKYIVVGLLTTLSLQRVPDIVQGKGNVITGEGGNIVVGDNNQVHAVDPDTIPTFYTDTLQDLRKRFQNRFADSQSSGAQQQKDSPKTQPQSNSAEPKSIAMPVVRRPADESGPIRLNTSEKEVKERQKIRAQMQVRALESSNLTLFTILVMILTLVTV